MIETGVQELQNERTAFRRLLVLIRFQAMNSLHRRASDSRRLLLNS
jgi:hypothetical protein